MYPDCLPAHPLVPQHPPPPVPCWLPRSWPLRPPGLPPSDALRLRPAHLPLLSSPSIPPRLRLAAHCPGPSGPQWELTSCTQGEKTAQRVDLIHRDHSMARRAPSGLCKPHDPGPCQAKVPSGPVSLTTRVPARPAGPLRPCKPHDPGPKPGQQAPSASPRAKLSCPRASAQNGRGLLRYSPCRGAPPA